MFKRKFTTQQVILTGMLAALAGVLMALEISLPFMPPFYKFDFSVIPSVIGLFLMGPVEGALIEVIKLIIKVILSGTNTMYVGEFANLIIILLFIIPTWLIYKKLGKTRKAAIIALVCSVLIRTACECFMNAFVSLPLYAAAMGISLDEVVKLVGGVNKNIDSLQTFIIYATIPFNIIKYGINSFLAYAIYDRLLSSKSIVRQIKGSEV
ncbi:MAG: ECF transporter S component [Lachnospiraceae bacterium]|nr:ECF transporter S component [Lachnospiraceae bacterium]